MKQNASAPAFERLHIPKAPELLAQRLRTAMLLGQLPEGASLPSEKELVAQLGISRATVREGLRLLEAEGLIETRPGRGGGAIVRHPGNSIHTRSLALMLQFGATTLAELLQARRAIEPYCGRLAAERVRNAAVDLQPLRDALERLAALTAQREAYLEAQVSFHLRLVEASANRVLQIYATSLAELSQQQIRDVPFTPADLEEGVLSCASILTALVEGDPDRTERRIARHLEAIEAAIVRLGWPLTSVFTNTE